MQINQLALSLPPHICPFSHHRQPNNLSASLIFLNRRKSASPLSVSASAIPPPEVGLTEGPIELPSTSIPIFSTTDDPTALQVATSVLLTGAVSVFLFRSVRRRIKRAKELRFRSTGAQKTLKDEALASLKALGSAPIEGKKPPSPVQAFLGAIGAGVIALVLYKFTTTIEASLNRQTISDNFSVRQITITIRTIINGVCYLATCVFGVNSVGLFLYSVQLAIDSFMEGGDGEERTSQGNVQSGAADSSSDSAELGRSEGDQSSDKKQ